MNKIKLIIEREYFTRVKKTSFIVMSILGPLLIAGIFIIPLWLQKLESKQVKNIAVIDESGILAPTLKSTENVVFTDMGKLTIDEAQKGFSKSEYYAVLFIPKNILNSTAVQIFSNRQPDFGLKQYIAKLIEKDLETLKLLRSQVNPDLLKAVQTPIFVQTIKWTSDGREIEVTMEMKTIIGTVASMLIYIFIFLYGSQVMRGVVEEKVNRIVEIIISSVRPLQLMIGKIAGIMLVGLTQFALWIVITFSVVWMAQVTLFPEPAVPTAVNQTATIDSKVLTQVQALGQDEYQYALDIFGSVSNVNWTLMIVAFLFFFICGYLLYAAMFAAVGSAVDSESDTQQFVMPLTVPMVISLLMIQVILNNPDGSIAFWMSMIPFTSPIAMMARIPFGVPIWEVVLSSAILIATIVLMANLAAKIYRTGILMYGKKVTYRELVKWIRYSS
jgi:ABC-2 type transport system permease protein